MIERDGLQFSHTMETQIREQLQTGVLLKWKSISSLPPFQASLAIKQS
ncbi:MULTISPECIES: hypothetical protein [Gracilibacillus]|nr:MULTISPECIES: hypothetical protein [Gracilibacillus]